MYNPKCVIIMLGWIFAILLIKVTKCQTPGRRDLAHIDEMPVAQFGDAEHRGPNFYDYRGASKDTSMNTLENEYDSSLSVITYSESSSDTSSGSSKLTSENKRATQFYRACTPCTHDMLKKYTNVGIKWLCAGYQRARRTFKSECMMRYRNCQDGTMFVKLYDHKCKLKDDPYHGRSWFYVYKV